MSIINWGIIGLGNIAYKFASAFEEVSNSKIVSVASNDPKKLSSFQKQFKINAEKCYDNYEKVILNNEVDIVYIALPHNFHFEWIMRCISLKKSVLTEKPATINYEQMTKINENLNKTKIFFSEGFMYRFHPQTLELINIIKQNEIGELLNMQSYFGVNIVEKKNIFGFKRIKINKKSRLFDKSLGGGSILDLGCYPSSLSLLIASLKSDDYKKKFILTDIKKTIGSSDVDLEAFSKINFYNEFTSNIGSSFKRNLGKSSIIIGSKGKIILPDSWHCETLNIIVNGNDYKINQKYKNIFSYEIENISNSLLNNEIEPKYPAIKRDETEMNMNILTRWLNENNK
tara:strand:- start:1164 stop:2192 length:1029 start_codon:yes stop_codon:yes gene_type:complete